MPNTEHNLRQEAAAIVSLADSFQRAIKRHAGKAGLDDLKRRHDLLKRVALATSAVIATLALDVQKRDLPEQTVSLMIKIIADDLAAFLTERQRAERPN